MALGEAVTVAEYMRRLEDEGAKIPGPSLKCNLCGELTEWEHCMGVDTLDAGARMVLESNWVEVLCTGCYWTCDGDPM